MSVDIKDFRRHVEGAVQREVPKPIQFMAQAQTEVPVTEDERFNKLIRVLQSDIDGQEANLRKLSDAAMIAVNQEQKLQLTYTFFITKGICEALKGVQQIPARILAEETPQHSA
mgnify:CR=1 FL=1